MIFFDDNQRNHLFPLLFTRPAATLRCGILTIAEKWVKWLGQDNKGFDCATYLHGAFKSPDKGNLLRINGRIMPDERLVEAVNQLKEGEALFKDQLLLAYVGSDLFESIDLSKYHHVIYPLPVASLQRPHDIFSLNGAELEKDFTLLTKGRTTCNIQGDFQAIDEHRIFAEEGVSVWFSSINASSGPVYLAKDSEIMEGCHVRGGFALGEGSSLKMGAKIYGPTTIGPHSKVGGEVNNSVIMGYSNKGHDGFLGNSVIGEWCNLGADTNNSNLKNNYLEVKLWNYATNRFDRTGLQFCGLIMGDHAKCGINTMFNTGTVVGVAANIFGSGFPRNFVPSFSWGGASGFETYMPEKVFETARKVYERRGIIFGKAEEQILLAVFEQTAAYRFWESKPKVD